MKAINNLIPNVALKSLERLIGHWKVSGEAYGEVMFNWMEGGFFMVQDIDVIGVKGIEFIGYDEQNGTLKSHYFDEKGCVLECTYEVTETDHIVIVDMPEIKGEFRGKFSNGGKMISGDWRWKKNGKEMRYFATLTKVN